MDGDEVTDINERAFELWQASAQKFDYFVVGLAGAVTAYLGKDFHPGVLGFNPSTAELAALLCTCGSVVAGVKRIEYFAAALSANHDALAKWTTAKSLVAAAESTAVQEAATGRLVPPAEVKRKLGKLEAGEQKAKDRHRTFSDKAVTAYKWRNGLLLFGFLLLVASRLWQAYL